MRNFELLSLNTYLIKEDKFELLAHPLKRELLRFYRLEGPYLSMLKSALAGIQLRPAYKSIFVSYVLTYY